MPKPLTAEECVAVGGHCWVGDGMVLTTGYTSHVAERCKHCPASRSGVSREPWEWTYPDGQP